MDQFHMADLANYAANVPMKTKVKGSEDQTANKEQDFTVDSPSFNDLLLEKGEQTGTTKEQEHLAAVLLSGMQILENVKIEDVPQQMAQPKDEMVSGELILANDVINVQMAKEVQSKIKQPQDVQVLETKIQNEPQQMPKMETLPKEEKPSKEENTMPEQFKESVGQMQPSKETVSILEPTQREELPTMQPMEGVAGQQESVFLSQQQVVQKKEFHPTTFHETMKVTSKEEIPQNLATKIVEHATKGIQEFEIQIEPENLGKMAVKLEYRNGEALISIVCTEPKTLELVKNHVEDIRSVVQRNLQEDMTVFVDEKKAETFAQQDQGNSDAGRESEWERQKEKRKREAQVGSHRFLQELRLGLQV